MISNTTPAARFVHKGSVVVRIVVRIVYVVVYVVAFVVVVVVVVDLPSSPSGTHLFFF